jgi:hypothetical protein
MSIFDINDRNGFIEYTSISIGQINLKTEHGIIILKYIDTTNATQYEFELNRGDSITNNIGEPHQLFCLEEGDILEVSTQHFDHDSYRVMKGNSQK